MIIRRRHTANFTTIGNALFEDERLAADEVGILAYLLSRPHDWEVRRPALMRRWGVGRDTLKRVMNNWMRTGWCRAEKTRLPDGTFDIVYEIRDEPGPDLSEDEVKRALSLVSSEATIDEANENPAETCTDALDKGELCADPPTSQPGVADPLLADPHVVHIERLNTDLPRKDSNQKPEREAIGHDRKARFITAFEMRWPTAASDDRQRTAKACRDLLDGDEDAALASIGPFLEKLKRDGRKHVPAGWKYLEESRWTLLASDKSSDAAALTHLAPGSDGAKAVMVLYALIGKSPLPYFMRTTDGGVSYLREMTPQLMALCEAPPRDQWAMVDRQQAGAWNGLLEKFVTIRIWNRLTPGAYAPWPWPPRKDGTNTHRPRQDEGYADGSGNDGEPEASRRGFE